MELKRRESPKQKIVLLIIEDDPFSRAFANEAFKNLKEYNIIRHTAGNCSEALVSFKTVKPNITLIDIGLPDGDGFSLLEKFREMDPNCRNVMLTASRVEADVKRSLQMGAVDYIVKPFNGKRLQAVIQGYLKSRK